MNSFAYIILLGIIQGGRGGGGGGAVKIQGGASSTCLQPTSP